MLSVVKTLKFMMLCLSPKFRSVVKNLATPDIGLLTFTSLVLGSILKGDDRLSIIWIGSGITVLLITVGIILLSTGGEKWNH